MKYITLNEFSKTIRDNIWRIPHDIDFVIGIPRSGTIAASIISEYLNKPLIDINSFCTGAKPTGGGRLRYVKKEEKEGEKLKVLVVDDTVFTGLSKKKARAQLEQFNDTHEFIFLAIYLEGPAKDSVDIYFEDLRSYTENYKQAVLYEWNIFHHNESMMKACIYDIDGVLCLDPPDERSGEPYIEYIKNATPLFTPTTTIGAIMTYRLTIYREITEKWLADNGIKYDRLLMFKAKSWDERNESGVSPEAMKGGYYKQAAWAKLFVESNDYQAQRIFQISGKPVFCVETNKLYSA